MTVLHALLFGVVQGFTEFLPVSSSGHLVLVPEFFGIPAPTVAFDVLVHVATLVAVVGYFVRDLAKMAVALLAPRRMSKAEVKLWRRLFAWLIVGSIPAAIAGFTLSGFFEGLFDSTLSVGVFLIVTSLLLTGADIALGRISRPPLSLEKMRGTDALIVGCFQALAIAPGLSRSGATIASGVLLGFDRPVAARFSFLLSVPAILGAFLFNLRDIGEGVAGTSGTAYVAGAVAAAVSGFLAIYLVMRFVKHHKFRPFAVYTFLLGALVVVLSLI